MPYQKFYKELADVVSYLHAYVVRKQFSTLIQGKIGFAQMVALEMLRRKNKLRMSDIARNLGITKSAVTGITDRLIRDGLIKKERSQSDRRVTRLALTSRGNRMANKINLNKRKLMRVMFSSISEKDRNTYLRIVRTIRNNLERKK